MILAIASGSIGLYRVDEDGAVYVRSGGTSYVWTATGETKRITEEQREAIVEAREAREALIFVCAVEDALPAA